jgi:hypothetical protein
MYEYKKKCYSFCPEYTLPSSDNNHCLINCPENLPFEKNEECIENCNILEFLNNICIINNKNINAKEYIVNEITKEIINGSLDSLLLNLLNKEKEDLIVKDMKEIYQITSINNQKYNDYQNGEITINLGECENILKNKYYIDNNETLIIFKMDYFMEDFLIPITEYEVFHPLTKEQLDLNCCNNIPINIFIPVQINEEYLYKHDPYSDYYKEKTCQNKTDCENDNILNERINDFNNNNLSLCEKNCSFKGYNKDTKKVLCQCKIKSIFSSLSEILSKKSELLYKIKIENDSLLYEEESDLYQELITFEDINKKEYIPVNTKE